MSVGGGGAVGGTNSQLLMLSPNLIKKNFFCENFLCFRTKIGTVLFLTLSTKWFSYTKYRRTTIRLARFSCELGEMRNCRKIPFHKVDPMLVSSWQLVSVSHHTTNSSCFPSKK